MCTGMKQMVEHYALKVHTHSDDYTFMQNIFFRLVNIELHRDLAGGALGELYCISRCTAEEPRSVLQGAMQLSAFSVVASCTELVCDDV